ncbi:MAG TPA: hypothetical protein VMN60_04265 [Longimicrobiales bacterium]|nr:hypothetical protein [Longimicrobiales bacterium]
MKALVSLVDFFRLHRRITLALFGVVISSAIILPACGDAGLTDSGPTDLSVTKTGVVSGQTVTYTITVSNNGSSTAQATVSDVVSSAPPGSQFTTAPAGICTPATGIAYSCTTPNITPGGMVVLTFVLTIPPGLSGDITNCASIPADDSSSDNQSCVTNTVIAPPATGRITIIKVAQPKTPQDFAFTSSKPAITAFLLDDDSDATLPNQRVFTDVAADTYVITETPVTGWTLASIECSPAGAATTSLATGAATIVLAGSASVSCTFTNVAVSPVITAVTPDTIANSSSAQPVTLTGTGFVTGANIVLRNTTTAEVFANLSARSFSSTQIVFDHTFVLNPAPQDWSVEVINPAGTSTGQRSFTVAPAIPVLTGLTTSPAAPTTAGEITLTLTGRDFLVTQANIVVTGPGCEPACAIENSALTTKTETMLVGSLRLTTAGTFTIFVQNTVIGQPFVAGSVTPGARSNSMPFDVASPPVVTASITGVTPASPTGSAGPGTVTITGANFMTGANVTLRNITTSETFANVTPVSVSGTQVVITPVFGIATTTQSWSVAVINPGAPPSNEFGFEVQAPTPVITALTTNPAAPTAGGVVELTIIGDNFSETAVVSVVPPVVAESIAGVSPASPVGSANPQTFTITVTPVNDPPIKIGTDDLASKSPTRLVGSLTLPNPGTYTVMVQNGAAAAGGPGVPTSNSVTFVAAPTVANPGPSIALRNIDTGTEVWLDITISGIPDTVSRSTEWEIQPVFGIATTLQTWSVAVNQATGSTAPFQFEVQAPTPTITSISTTPSPAVTAGAAGRSNVITLVGTEFSDVAARVLITGPGCEPCTIENSALTTKTATTLVGSMSFSRAGTFSVSVQNAGSSPLGPTGPQSAPINLIVVE